MMVSIDQRDGRMCPLVAPIFIHIEPFSTSDQFLSSNLQEKQHTNEVSAFGCASHGASVSNFHTIRIHTHQQS